MKKFNILFILILTTFFVACRKEDLSLPNPNQPTLLSLTSEAGIKSFALGIYEKFTGWANNDLPGGGTSGFMAAIGFHSEMGDDMFCPYGNWGTRWTAQIKSITLPNSTVVLGSNTTTLSQKDQLQAFNSREAGETNVFQYEWYSMYLTISTSNALLQALDNSALNISDTKKKALRAWALWWKGLAYSRIGSMYVAGIITNEPATGATNGDFKSRDLVLAEGNKNFDEALTVLGSLTQNADYDNIMQAVVPSFAGNDKIVNPAMWTRIINTYKARNLLVNKKVKNMVAADWNAILTLVNNGIQAGDNIFTLGQTPDGNRDVSGNFWHPFNLTNESSGFWFVSERLVQEYKNGDARKDKNFILWADQGQSDIVNLRGRGLLFGTRYNYVYIEDGGSFSSLNGNLGQWPISPTYEENELMKAEAKLRTGDINGGLGHVDAVRNFQSSGLSAVSNTGLTSDQALEELRRERRVALAIRGLAFYDARRWGITEPEASGGGRNGAIVLVPGNLLGSPSAQAVPCKVIYDYLDYWDIPANELDFNTPLPGSAAVKN